jgi:hypothetical protein
MEDTTILEPTPMEVLTATRISSISSSIVTSAVTGVALGRAMPMAEVLNMKSLKISVIGWNRSLSAESWAQRGIT